MKPIYKKQSILLGQHNNSLVLLIAINAIVFVIINFIKIAFNLSNVENVEGTFQTYVMEWLAFSADPNTAVTRPWTIFTYMFTHSQVWDLVISMLWLWAFGYILQTIAGNGLLAPVYLYGGFVGAVVFLATANLVPAFRELAAGQLALQTAGTAVMAVAVAATTYAPTYRIFPMLNGGIPLWVITLVFVLLNYAQLASDGAPSAAAHLGAGVMGFIFIKQYMKGRDWSLWMHQAFDFVLHAFDPERRKPKKVIQPEPASLRLHYKAEKKPSHSKPHITEARINELLDKISEKGIQSLTDDEREYLQRAAGNIE